MGSGFDRLKLRYHYLRKTGRLLNLTTPRLFTEKVQLAKLTWRSPRMVVLADKVKAKEAVAKLLGPEWVTPTLFAGAALPPIADRNWPVPFVVKSNHRSGGNHFVRRTEDLDWPAIEAKVDDWQGRAYGKRLVEWVYSEVVRQVLIEPFIGETAESPPDYKLYVFGGRVAFTSINWDRFTGLKRATFDRDWKRLPFVMNAYGDYDGDDIPRMPASYAEMIRGAEELAKGFPFARIDLYEINDRPRFGEVTFYPQSGLFRMPTEYDAYVGSLWPQGQPT